MEYNIGKIRKKQNVTFLKKHPSFCVLAFAHLRVQGRNYAGAVPPINGRASSLCCSAPSPVEVNVGPLDNIIQHEDFKQDREMFYANKLPAQCEYTCSFNYEHLTKREIVNAMHMETILYENIFKKPELKIIDYNFGNECNLSCRMCSASSSNQIAILASNAVSSMDDTKKLIEFGINDLAQENSIEENIENLKNEVFLRGGLSLDKEAIKEVLPNLNELQLVGGEPFVSKDVEDILLEAIKTGANEHIDLEITTNGTKFIEEKLDIFLQFKKINFIISIDGVGSTYDYIRYPFNFSLIEKRLRDIVDYVIRHKLEEKVIFRFACMGILYNLYDYEKLYSFLRNIFDKVTTRPVVMELISDVYGTRDETHALSWNNIPNEVLNDALLSYKKTQDYSLEHHGFQDDWYLKFKEYVSTRKEHFQETSYAKEHTLLLDKLHKRKYNEYLHPKLIKYIDSIK